jgi:peptidoglycan/LPS O-acetylase OafA/YrhL
MDVFMVKSKTGKNKERTPKTSSPLQSTGDSRITQVDLLKGFAIISVILIHTFSSNLLTVSGAPYHIWQAVPVFLLLAAFTGALSYRRLNKRSLLHCYDMAVLYKRFRRILLPFVVIWIIQVIVILYFWPASLPLYSQDSLLVYSGIFGIIAFFFTWASGPGNYFIPLILTQILILPFFYWLAVRFSPDKMLVFAFITDVVLQYVLFMVNMSAVVSAHSYLYYLFLTALGIWLALQQRKPLALVIIAGLLSFAYITAVYYFKFQIWFINPSSGFFNEFAYFWTLVLVLCGLRYLPSSSLTKPFESIANLGKASWHIFLVQMTVIAFFNYAMLTFLRSIVIRFGLPETLLFQLILQMINTLLTLVICLALGYGFYLNEEYVKNRVHRLLTPFEK